MTEQHEPAADGAEMPPAEDPQPGATEAPHTEGAGSDAFGAARHATAQAATALGAAVDQATPVMKALAARAADLAAEAGERMGPLAQRVAEHLSRMRRIVHALHVSS